MVPSNPEDDMRTVTIGEILTPDEVERSMELWKACPDGTGFAAKLATQVIAPALPRIDAATGQSNDAKFIAYMVEHAMRQSQGAGR